jgi:hypothetical protein
MRIGRCESCGRDEEDLVSVHRVYLRMVDDGSHEVDEQADVEGWCVSCCANYPHVPVPGI